MNNLAKCPICDSQESIVIGQRVYRLMDLPLVSEYAAWRYKVLFEVWFPGEAEVEIKWHLCKRCGFVYYLPRPTKQDLDRKYEYLCASASSSDSRLLDKSVEALRAAELYYFARKHCRVRGNEVLDFGGGDGRLMLPFLTNGWKCYLIDYSNNPIPGVIKLASTLDSFAGRKNFDLIVCSHVLEHVADPVHTLTQLRSLLKPQGSLYVEVPMEIWKRPPIHEEPVTHVNFFTIDSLRFALARANLDAICKLGTHLHSTNRRRPVLRAWAWPSTQAGDYIPSKNAASKTLRFLNPGLLLRLRFALLEPKALARRIFGRFLKR